MKFDEFKKYKLLIESDIIDFNDDEEIMRVYQWMQETGRIDEGFWGSIWGWLKKTFSITSRRLYKLADQYEQQLMEETRAEFGKAKDNKDIKSKIQAGYYSRMSTDIEERMDIIAGDDEDYRELVRVLINKKKLKVKKAMLSEFKDVFDDENELSTVTNKYDREDDKLNAELRNTENKLRQKLPDFKSLADTLNQDIQGDPYLNKILDRDQRAKFISSVISYVNQLSEKDSKTEVNSKTLKNVALKCADLIRKVNEKIEKSDIDTIVTELEKLLIGKNKSFDNISKELFHIIDNIETEEYSDDIAPDAAEEVLDKDAKEIKEIPVDTGKKNPTIEDKENVIKEAARKYFKNKDNFELILQWMNDNIDEFNDQDEETRKKYDHLPIINSENKIDPVDPEDVKKLAEEFVHIVGYIVPYYITGYSQKKSIHRANQTVAQSLFYVYLFKEDMDKKIDDSNMEYVINHIATGIDEPLTLKSMWKDLTNASNEADFKRAI